MTVQLEYGVGNRLVLQGERVKNAVATLSRHTQERYLRFTRVAAVHPVCAVSFYTDGITAMAFTKLDSGIIDSSLWSYPAEERIVWITLLARADETGYVRMSLPGLVRAANVSEDAVRAALTKFEAPDVESRTKDYNGVRLDRIEGGWLILNYMKYREKTDRDANREYMREYRNRKLHVSYCNLQNLTVELPSASPSASASASASASSEEKESKVPSKEEVAAFVAENRLNVNIDHFYAKYSAEGWSKSWRSSALSWSKREPQKGLI